MTLPVFTTHNSPLLSHLSLTSLDAVKSYLPSHRVKNHGGYRDVHRIDITPPDSDAPATLYLKRIWKAPRKDGLKSLLRHGHVRSMSRQEWINYELLRAAGIPTPQLIAFGEEKGLFWERFSFILTAAAPGRPLDIFLRSTPPSPLRRQTLRALALFIRELHQAGLYSPDLFTRHIFVSFSNPQSETRNPQFTLIDMARLNRAAPDSPRHVIRDLAALNITAPLSMVTRSERIRFLLTYNATAARLVPKISRRVNYLLHRRKYAPFLR